jgi:hypothetical protein
MNNLSVRRIFFLIFILSLAGSSVNGQIFHKNSSRKVEKRLYGKTTLGNKKAAKAAEPRSVTRAKKKQEAKKRKLDKKYAQSISSSRKRTVEIQSPEVQERMKQNQKESITRDKEKKRNIKTSTKKAGKKYK